MPQPVTPPNAPPRRTGRPPKINDPALRTRILDALRVGATYVHACAYGGIAYNTFNEWMKRGEAARSGAFLDFYEDVKKAEGDAVAKWLGVIDKAALDGQWQAAAWKLERRYPETYGRRIIQTEVSGRDGGPVEIRAVDYRAAIATLAPEDEP